MTPVTVKGSGANRPTCMPHLWPVRIGHWDINCENRVLVLKAPEAARCELLPGTRANIRQTEAVTGSPRRRRLSDSAWDALLEAVAVFYWYKPDQERFLRSALADYPEIVAQLAFGETKRQVASQLVMVLQVNEDRYQRAALDLVERLSEFDEAFGHLARLDDGTTKVSIAQTALAGIQAISGHNRNLLEERERARDRIERDVRSAELRRSHDAVLAELLQEFMTMFSMVDAQARGRQFETLIERLFSLHDLAPKAGYSLEHEQIDGAFTFRTDDYLLEAKWWNSPIDPKEINHFRSKVESKAANTLGLCISISGFTAGAIAKHSDRSPLLLMDGADFHAILENRISLTEVLERKRRHAAETGHPMYPVSAMLGGA